MNSRIGISIAVFLSIGSHTFELRAETFRDGDALSIINNATSVAAITFHSVDNKLQVVGCEEKSRRDSDRISDGLPKEFSCNSSESATELIKGTGERWVRSDVRQILIFDEAGSRISESQTLIVDNNGHLYILEGVPVVYEEGIGFRLSQVAFDVSRAQHDFLVKSEGGEDRVLYVSGANQIFTESPASVDSVYEFIGW